MSTSIWSQPMQPYPTDGVATETSESQAETEQVIQQAQAKSSPTPTLNRSAHASFLGTSLLSLPGKYVSLDASRPWLTYWTLHSFDLLGVGLDDEMKRRGIETVLAFQHPDGGFCGGPPPGHVAHLLPTYASIMTLAILCGDHSKKGGGVSEMGKQAWKRVDRQGLYEFFMRCKQPDGGFVVCQGGEVDVRGIYCLLVCATLLDILTPELVEGTSAFLKNCQTYEGGFASASFPTSDPSVCPASAEAHGGYTACGIFSWFLLRPLLQLEEGDHKEAEIDVHAALRWAALQQSYAIEGGGFRGRTNKLVDGCYGWWVGGLFSVLESLLSSEEDEEQQRDKVEEESVEESKSQDGDEGWEDLKQKDTLFNRTALQEYILSVAQNESGGLRDKPGKNPDLYHTANNLSGLSAAQHYVRHRPCTVKKLESESWTPSPVPRFILDRTAGKETEEQVQRRRRTVWAHARAWTEDEAELSVVGGDANRVNTTSPVFNALLLRVRPMMDYFYGQDA